MNIWLLLLLAVTAFATEDWNPYRVLGVSRHATENEIRSAFKKLSLKYHPDRGGEEAADKYAKIVNAYELLKNPQRKRQYDLTGSTSTVS
jgi:curved DNA-binding protein CbpA